MSKLRGKLPLQDARRVADKVLRQIGGKAMVCGSIRRRVPMVGDIDIVAIKTPSLSKALALLGLKVTDTMATGTVDGMPVAVYFATASNWGSMVMHFTGSKDLNIMMRGMAKKNGMTLNQYGVFRGSKNIASKTENEVYDALGVRHIKPEERNKVFKE
jgi:DNA polymerase (family 10)